jgi:hypothetical protein
MVGFSRLVRCSILPPFNRRRNHEDDVWQDRSDLDQANRTTGVKAK